MTVYEKLLGCYKQLREKTDFVPHIALVLGSGFQRSEEAFENLVRLGDGFQSDLQAVILHILHKEQSVVALFLGLDHVVVGVTVQIVLIIIVCDIQIKICAVEFFIDLLVKELCYLFIHHFIPLSSGFVLPAAYFIISRGNE